MFYPSPTTVYPLKFLPEGYQKIGPITYSDFDEYVGINPEFGVGSDKRGIIFEGNGSVSVNSDKFSTTVPVENFSISNYTFNPIGTVVPSTLVSPTQTFILDLGSNLATIKIIGEMLKCLDEFNKEDYNGNIKYFYDVLDYDDFSPS